MDSAAWRGPVGDVWAGEWRRTDRSFAGLAPHLDVAIRAAAPAGGVTVMDIGCGAGATTLALARARPDLTVVGTDLSASLVDVARDRCAAYPNTTFRVGDSIPIAGEIAPAMLVSRHGVMFFEDPMAAFGTIAGAVAPGTPFVFSCFAARADNPWATEPLAAIGRGGETLANPADAPGPFAFADPARVGALLDGTGWHAPPPERIDFAYVAGAGDDPVGDAMRFFARIGPAAPRLRELGHAAAPALATVCERRHVGETVAFPAAAWIWSAIRGEGTAP